MKFVLIALALCVAAASAAGFYYMSMHVKIPPSQTSYRVVHVGTETLTLEVADTDALRTQGLSGRESLQVGSGMLFVFDPGSPTGIWMKGMHFPIDIIWLNASGTVVTIKENASPDSYPQVFLPKEQALYVIEVPAGYAALHGIAEGDKFQL